MDKLMQGKAIIVTGAGSVGAGWGNGKAAAVLYAREGGRVLAVDRSIEAALETQEIIRSEGGECEVLAADVSAVPM
jgi:NAD(P)-dependent dehydrogenase (short-subunit alcohol dehydrogenase family)